MPPWYGFLLPSPARTNTPPDKWRLHLPRSSFVNQKAYFRTKLKIVLTGKRQMLTIRDVHSVGYLRSTWAAFDSIFTLRNARSMSSMFFCSSDAAGSGDENGVEKACNFHRSFANPKFRPEQFVARSHEK